MTHEEWKNDFKGFINELSMPKDDYNGIMEYIDEVPNEDAISRAYIEPIIEELENICVNGDEHILDLLADIKNAPPITPKQRWIPVSERLPKDNGWYRCTVIINDLPRTIELFYKNGKWLDNRRIDMFNTYDIYGYGNTTEKHKLSYQELISEFDWTKNVIAWMPLPEPYKAESEDKG